MEIHVRPLDGWPGPMTAKRKRSPFHTKFPASLRKLKEELQALDAKTVVVQLAVREKEISITSGWPLPGTKPAHPGVIVMADTRHGAQKWPCDDCQAWTDNLHAIALTLERLRLVRLYNVGREGQQYAGYKMLPGPITAGTDAPPSMTIEEAARFVAVHTPPLKASSLINIRSTWEKAYRAASQKLHPDKPTGSEEQWARLQDAAKLLNSLHSRK
jgi:hypothetical protein